MCGLNVTIPYKETVISFLDELDETAAAVGAVNTIAFSNGKTTGFNTDCYGFEMSLKPFLKSHHHAALVLGTGGAAKAVCFVLKKLGIDFLQVSRTPGTGKISYEKIDQAIINAHKIIINTTPLGMHPNVESLPAIPYQFVSDEHLFYDLVYNPAETAFLKKGKESGAATINGLEMLHLQAAKSWEIWNF